MLFSTFLVALATSAAGVSALTTTTISANVVLPGGSTIICTATGVLNHTATATITRTITSTYCAACDTAKATGGVFTSVYETTLLAVCPTGLTSSKYTVTAVVTGTTPIDHKTVPAGFTTTVAICTGCAVPSAVTVTVPIGAVVPTGPVIPVHTFVPGAPAVSSAAAIPGSPAAPGAPAVSSAAAVPGSPAAPGAPAVSSAAAVPGAPVQTTAAGVSTKVTGATQVTAPAAVFTGAASPLFDPLTAMVGGVGAIFAGMLFL